MAASHSSLEQSLAVHGLRLRGGWSPTPHDALPSLAGGAPAAVVWIVGQVGSECWPVFSSSHFFCDGLPDPMDRWSKSIGDLLARRHGGVAIYPSDGPPYAPFQQWAQRAEPLQRSPLLLQIHPQFGLWHAYRFALLLPDVDARDRPKLARNEAMPAADLCLQCDGQPCLTACPVDAFAPHGYATDVCAAHLHGEQAGECMSQGCLARRACPEGVSYRYAPAHAAFHMQAFAQRH